MKRDIPSRADVAAAVTAYNAVYSEMDEALWCVSKSLRGPLLRHESVPGLEVLVWTVRSWWGVRGVKTETRSIAARALAEMEWSPGMFEDGPGSDPRREAVDRVMGLVRRMNELGVRRKELSLSAKVVHWLTPWRVPIYDSFVCRSVGISASARPARAYSELVAWEFDAAERLADGSRDWIGGTNPRSAIRAIDKYLWWIGGGDQGASVRVKDPWRICRELGIRRG
jgi:hypothetical protein